jgi:hypothetical protein
VVVWVGDGDAGRGGVAALAMAGADAYDG